MDQPLNTAASAACGTSSTRKLHNTLVTTRRCRAAVRQEIITSAKNFLNIRMNDEQDEIVIHIRAFLDARTDTDMIACSRETVSGLFGTSAVLDFSDEVIGHFVAGNLPVPLVITDSTGKLLYLLKIAAPDTVFSKLVQSYIVSSPHSCGPERVVSCHTALKTSKQSAYSRDALNSRLCIALNSAGTAHFDPRPAVARFLTTKERRVSAPHVDLYRNREFVKKFFAADTVL